MPLTQDQKIKIGSLFEEFISKDDEASQELALKHLLDECFLITTAKEDGFNVSIVDVFNELIDLGKLRDLDEEFIFAVSRVFASHISDFFDEMDDPVSALKAAKNMAMKIKLREDEFAKDFAFLFFDALFESQHKANLRPSLVLFTMQILFKDNADNHKDVFLKALKLLGNLNEEGLLTVEKCKEFYVAYSSFVEEKGLSFDFNSMFFEALGGSFFQETMELIEQENPECLARLRISENLELRRIFNGFKDAVFSDFEFEDYLSFSLKNFARFSSYQSFQEFTGVLLQSFSEFIEENQGWKKSFLENVALSEFEDLFEDLVFYFDSHQGRFFEEYFDDDRQIGEESLDDVVEKVVGDDDSKLAGLIANRIYSEYYLATNDAKTVLDSIEKRFAGDYHPYIAEFCLEKFDEIIGANIDTDFLAKMYLRMQRLALSGIIIDNNYKHSFWDHVKKNQRKDPAFFFDLTNKLMALDPSFLRKDEEAGKVMMTGLLRRIMDISLSFKFFEENGIIDDFSQFPESDFFINLFFDGVENIEDLVKKVRFLTNAHKAVFCDFDEDCKDCLVQFMTSLLGQSFECGNANFSKSVKKLFKKESFCNLSLHEVLESASNFDDKEFSSSIFAQVLIAFFNSKQVQLDQLEDPRLVIMKINKALDGVEPELLKSIYFKFFECCLHECKEIAESLNVNYEADNAKINNALQYCADLYETLMGFLSDKQNSALRKKFAPILEKMNDRMRGDSMILDSDESFDVKSVEKFLDVGERQKAM